MKCFFIPNKLPFHFRHVPHDVIEVLLLTSVLSLLVTKHMCVSLRLHVAGPHETVPIVKFNEKKAKNEKFNNFSKKMSFNFPHLRILIKFFVHHPTHRLHCKNKKIQQKLRTSCDRFSYVNACARSNSRI